MRSFSDVNHRWRRAAVTAAVAACTTGAAVVAAPVASAASPVGSWHIAAGPFASKGSCLAWKAGYAIGGGTDPVYCGYIALSWYAELFY